MFVLWTLSDNVCLCFERYLTMYVCTFNVIVQCIFDLCFERYLTMYVCSLNVVRQCMLVLWTLSDDVWVYFERYQTMYISALNVIRQCMFVLWTLSDNVCLYFERYQTMYVCTLNVIRRCTHGLYVYYLSGTIWLLRIAERVSLSRYIFNRVARGLKPYVRMIFFITMYIIL